MDTGRPDLNSSIKTTAIAQDEPVFILRPKDPSAAATVRAWAAFSAIAGVPPATLEQALVQADRMDAWPHRKLPGDDHLELEERLHLEYQHQRRLWDGTEFSPWRLAEIRGHMPEDPAALMRQLAAEQQRAASLYTAKAARHLAEASSRDNKDRSRAYLDRARQLAESDANRAAYFLAIATALSTAADILARPMLAGAVG